LCIFRYLIFAGLPALKGILRMEPNWRPVL
jgi:hypothetical protein